MLTLTGIEETPGSPASDTPQTLDFEIASDVVTGEELIRSYVYQIHRDREHAVRQDKLARD